MQKSNGIIGLIVKAIFTKLIAMINALKIFVR